MSKLLDEITAVLKISIVDRDIFIEHLQNHKIDFEIYDMVRTNRDIFDKCYTLPSSIKAMLDKKFIINNMCIKAKSSLYKSVVLVTATMF